MGIQKNTPSVVTDGLVYYLDAANRVSYAGSGTTWRDLNGGGINASLVNGPVYSANNGGYISLDGTNDYIQAASNCIPAFGSGSFTVEYWFRKTQTTDIGSYDNIWGVNQWDGRSAGINQWSLAIGRGDGAGGNEHRFAIESGSTSYGTGYASALTVNTWYQLVGQRDGTTFNLYRNTILVATATPSGFTANSIINNFNIPLRIGVSDSISLFTASNNAILRIYNKALSRSEIIQNYNIFKSRFGLT